MNILNNKTIIKKNNNLIYDNYFGYILKTDKKDKDRIVFNRFFFLFDRKYKKNNVKIFFKEILNYKKVKKINFLHKYVVKKNFYSSKKKVKMFKVFAITFDKDFNLFDFFKNKFLYIIKKINLSDKEAKILNIFLNKEDNKL
jgi:hypothetical protein